MSSLHSWGGNYMYRLLGIILKVVYHNSILITTIYLKFYSIIESIQQLLMRYLVFFFFHLKSSKSNMYFTLTLYLHWTSHIPSTRGHVWLIAMIAEHVSRCSEAPKDPRPWWRRASLPGTEKLKWLTWSISSIYHVPGMMLSMGNPKSVNHCAWPKGTQSDK